MCTSYEGLDPLDKFIASVNVDACIAVRNPWGFFHRVIFYIPPGAVARERTKPLIRRVTAWLATLSNQVPLIGGCAAS
jgi:hypothetical protein